MKNGLLCNGTTVMLKWLLFYGFELTSMASSLRNILRHLT